MDARQFERVKEFFDVVCDLPAASRAARVAELTDDADVIAEVLKLAGQTSIRNTRFAAPVINAISMVAGDDLQVGDTLGAWTLTSEIGQGGMGRVFRAKRSDGHFEQDAAIKVLQGLPSAKALEYLARERQILATLVHPNIARLYDGGATPGGQPYLVMEYIDGVAIDKFVGERHATVPARLKLMLEVCDALSFAHQRLIVHCDIKPSNILVTKAGRPMLLDFGIARLLDGETVIEPAGDVAKTANANAATSKLTTAHAFTPQYASPEQQKGEVLTTATDVYSLGCMLKELLEIKDANNVVTKVDAELRAIVAKASHPYVAQRYATANALAADIECYFAKRPLQAMPHTAGYVSRKFIERFWPWLAATTIMVATVSLAAQRVVVERDRAQSAEKQALKERDATQLAQAAAVRERDSATRARTEAVQERDRATGAEQATARQRDIAAQAETRAVSERDRARASEVKAMTEKNRATQAEAASKQTSEFLVSVFDSSSPDAQSGDIPASKLIAAAEARLVTQLQGQPETQATLYSTLARVQSNMGAPTKARQNFLRAIEIERKLNRPLELARMLTLEFQNDVLKLDNRNLIALATEALKLREQFAPADSDEVAQSLAFMAYAYRATSGNLKEAERLIVRSIAIRESSDPVGIGMAETMHIAGQVYAVLGQREKAIECYRRSIAIKQDKLGEGHPEILISLQYLAGELNRTRQFVEAEAIFRRIVGQNETLHGRLNVNMLRPLIYLGKLLGDTGRSREALQIGQEALQIAEKTVGRDSTYAALAISSVGSALMDLGDDLDAATHFREALGLMKKYMRPIDNAVAEQELQLGRALNRLGNYDQGRPHLIAAYDIYRTVLGDAHRETALVVTELMRASVASDRLDDAAMWQAQLSSAGTPMEKNKDEEVAAMTAMANAMLAAKKGGVENVGEAFTKAERLFRDLYGDGNAKTWLAMLPRCEWLAQRGQPASEVQSRALAKQILTNVREKLNGGAPVLAKLERLQPM